MVCFEQKDERLWVVTKPTELHRIPRACYKSKRLNRLDEIVNHLNLQPSKICHTDYTQTGSHGSIKISPCPITDGELDIAESLYGLCINVWTSERVQGVYYWRQIRFGNTMYKIVVGLHRTRANELLYNTNVSSLIL